MRRAMTVPLARLAVAAWLALPSAAAAVDVYVVAGQSNAHRLSALRPGSQAIPGGRRIFYYGMSCTEEPVASSFRVLASLDPEASGTALALGLVERSQGDIVLVQYCRCGSAVWRRREGGWFPGEDPRRSLTYGGGLFGRLERYVAAAEAVARRDLGLDWEAAALFWHQGESDSAGDHHREYESRLRDLFWRFRQLLGESLPIVVAEIRELDDGDRAINRALAAIAGDDPRVALARAADLDFERSPLGRPGVHLSLEGCRKLGRRMVAAYETISPRTAP